MLQASVKVHAQQDNVAGVKIPKFEQLDVGSDTKMNLTGLGAGGQQVQATRKVQHCFARVYLFCTSRRLSAQQSVCGVLPL